MPKSALGAVAGYRLLWLMPGSQEIKEGCSDSAIPNSLAVPTLLEWSTVTQEFWVRILVDTEYFPLGITSVTRPSVKPDTTGCYLTSTR